VNLLIHSSHVSSIWCSYICCLKPFGYHVHSDGMCTQTPRVAATWQSCYSEVCRNNFAEVGKLGNISDTNFRAANDSLPVMAFALDLGNITQSENSLVFAIGLFRNTTIWYYERIQGWNRNHCGGAGGATSGMQYVLSYVMLVSVRTHAECCLE
jgi:hypothetical protein